MVIIGGYGATPLSVDNLASSHVVMAYGYNKAQDTFLVHMGWHGIDDTEMIISDVTIHSYYSLIYKG